VLSFDEARARILTGVTPVETETVGLSDAAGRVLGESLHATSPIPGFDYSAMDGYAVATGDFSGDGPWTLPVVGESRTGKLAPDRMQGTACRIFTGAPIPAGADAVVMQEDVTRTDAGATFATRPRRGSNVRHAGEDLAAGALALASGARLGPGQLGLVASLDRGEVLVSRKPLVRIVCTGDELRAAGSPHRPGSIPESNGVALAAFVNQVGGHASVAAYARDDREETTRILRQALDESDLVLTVGGASVGDHDLVRPALEDAGAHLEFWKVRIKPGKPLVFGKRDAVAILGLPGNPVSALVTFALFGAPLIRALAGDAQPAPPNRTARLGHPVEQKPGRRSFYRAHLAGDVVNLVGNQASGNSASMALANCLLILPEDSAGAAAGSSVEVLVLGDV
jgi:molybdopterin molybdotransferase